MAGTRKVVSEQGRIFSIVQSLGSGGFGAVYEVIDDETQEHFALKALHPYSIDDIAIAALKNEAEMASKIMHKNVARLHFFDNGSRSGVGPFLLVELIKGESLRRRIDTYIKHSSLPKIEDLVSIYSSIIDGMEAINSFLIHRDIQPGNILLHEGEVKIIDFGLSKFIDAVTRTHTFKGIQHIRYKPPEAWLKETNNIQLDMYSAGMVFYELATTRHPLPPERDGVDPFHWWRETHIRNIPTDISKLRPDLPPQISEIIMKMINKRSKDRYDNWESIRARLKSSFQKPVSPEITDLWNIAKENARKKELQRIATEKTIEEQRNNDAILEFSFTDLQKKILHVIQEFNETTDLQKFQINYNNNKFTIISSSGRRIIGRCEASKTIEVHDSNAFSLQGPVIKRVPLTYRNKNVTAWGAVFMEGTHRGFNILLLKENDEDLYGNWIALENFYGGFYNRGKAWDEPFAFIQWNDFSKRVQHMNSLDIYESREVPLHEKTIISLIKEIM